MKSDAVCWVAQSRRGELAAGLERLLALPREMGAFGMRLFSLRQQGVPERLGLDPMADYAGHDHTIPV